LLYIRIAVPKLEKKIAKGDL